MGIIVFVELGGKVFLCLLFNSKSYLLFYLAYPLVKIFQIRNTSIHLCFLTYTHMYM